MPELLAEAYAEGRFGPYAVRIRRRAGTGGTPVPLDLDEDDDLVLRYGTLTPAFGRGIFGSELDAAFRDGTGLLDELFGGRFTDTDFEVVLTGPDGRGGTIAWSGLPMPGTLDVTAAPLTEDDPRVALSAQCGLGKASDAPGTAPGRVQEPLAIAQFLQRLQTLNPLTIVAGTSLWPSNAPLPAPQRLLTRLGFVGKIAGDGAGDYGTFEEELLAFARNFGAVIFQSLTGFWYVLPRYRIGRAQPVTRIVNANTIDAFTLAANTAEAADVGDDGRVRRVRQLGAVEFTSTQGGDLVTDGTFTYRQDGGSPLYWTASPLNARPDALGPGQTLTQALVRVDAAPDLYVEVELEQDWIEYDVDGAPGIHWAAPAEIALYVASEAGVPFRYGPDWGTGARTMGVGVPITPTDPETDRHIGVRATTRPIDFSGRLTVQVVGGQTIGEAEPTASRPRRVAVRIVDATGAVVESYTYRIGDGSGETVTITPLPLMRVSVDGQWVAVTGYVSDLTGLSYLTQPEATAAERIAQQGQNLRVLAGEVDTLLGPETLLVMPGRDTEPASPFAEAVEMVAAGLELHILPGRTAGVWVEKVTDGGTSAVGGTVLKAGEVYEPADDGEV